MYQVGLRLIPRFAKGHSGRVTFVGMDRLNKTLVSASSDGFVLVSIS